MCLGNTTTSSSAILNDGRWESVDAWERDQRTPQERAMHPPGSRNEDGSYGASTPRTRAKAREALKTKPKAQSSKTSGGAY